MTFPEDLTIAEVAQATRLSIPAVHWNIRHKKLKATFKYRQYHISPENLTAFLTERARKCKKESLQ